MRCRDLLSTGCSRDTASRVEDLSGQSACECDVVL